MPNIRKVVTNPWWPFSLSLHSSILNAMKDSKLHIEENAFHILLPSGYSVLVVKCKDQMDMVIQHLRAEFGPGCFV